LVGGEIQGRANAALFFEEISVSAAALFAPLPTVPGGFPCLASDVPSLFRSNSETKPGRNARRHYKCHSMATLAMLPVADVAARDAFLFFWTTGPLLAIGAHIPVKRAWGFDPTAIAFNWPKLNSNAPTLFFSERDFFFGPGLTTRRHAEYVVLGHCGKPKRLAADVRKLIIAPRGKHSEKPHEVYSRIERYCARPRLELFARKHREGWTCWSDELPRQDESAGFSAVAAAPIRLRF
jgi:N6-adenosine-specific RNA methylase IME4